MEYSWRFFSCPRYLTFGDRNSNKKILVLKPRFLLLPPLAKYLPQPVLSYRYGSFSCFVHLIENHSHSPTKFPFRLPGTHTHACGFFRLLYVFHASILLSMLCTLRLFAFVIVFMHLFKSIEKPFDVGRERERSAHTQTHTGTAKQLLEKLSGKSFFRLRDRTNMYVYFSLMSGF